MLTACLLGKYDLQMDGRPIDLASRPAQSLLAYLLLNPNTRLRREKLAGMFWPEAGEANARSNLRHALWRIRRALGEGGEARLEADDLAVIYHPQPGDWLDAAVLQAVLPPPDTPEAPVEDLLGAVQACGGELLPGFYEPWVTLERERLQAVYESKAQRLLEALIQQQRWPEVVRVAEEWIKQGGVPEPAYRALILAYAAQGSRPAAIAAYQRCCEALQREVGVVPSPQTEALAAQVRQGAGVEEMLAGLGLAKLEVTSPPMSEKENGISRGGVLPSPLTSFIGRKQQLAELRLLLLAASMEGTTGRLITLAGAGGCGKTRLALQAAGALPEEAGLQGAWFVELAALTDAALIPQAIMAVLDIQQTGETPPLEALLNFLRARRLLLILDNCEHLVDGCAALVARLLQTCPHLVVLATSRETLDVPGEVVYRVPPMAIPDDGQPGALLQSEAVQLFVERARAAWPGNVQAFEREAPLVGQICHRLDGIPLAIELAAARTHLLSLEQIAARLDDCFRLLTGGSRTDLPHHQTLRATMDWSYNLLDESEQRLFWRLSLFAGGWTLEAAEAVCSDPDGHASADPGRLDRAEILDLLGGLVAKSMIHVLHSVPQTGSLAAAPTPVHYSMLETLRQYAREKLAAAGELDRLQERFLAYYRDLAEQARAGFRGPQQNTWLVRMEQETNNLHAALEYAFPTPDSASGPSEQGIYLAGSLFAFWRRSGNHAEFVAWRDRILAVCDRQPLTPGLVRALTNAGMEMWLFKPPAFSFRILPMLEAGITVLDGEGETGRVDYARLLTLIGFIYLRTPGRLPEGRAYVEHGLAILRQAGASWELASALFLSGYPLYHMHHDESVLAWFEESTALFRQVGDRMAWGEATAHLGSCAVARGDLESASRYFQESVEILLEGGPSLAKPTCSGLINLGEVARCQGDYDRAGACYRRALRVLEQAGLMQGGPATESYTTAYWNLGFVELHRGNIEQALVCFRSGRSDVSYDDELDQEQYEIRDLLAYASLAAAMGKSEAAAHLLGANDALWHQLEADRPGMQFYDPADQLEIEHYQGMVQDQLGPEAYAAAWQAGRQMDLEQAQRYAHDLFPG